MLIKNKGFQNWLLKNTTCTYELKNLKMNNTSFLLLKNNSYKLISIFLILIISVCLVSCQSIPSETIGQNFNKSIDNLPMTIKQILISKIQKVLFKKIPFDCNIIYKKSSSEK